MAGLDLPRISAAQQFKAVAFLRWCLFRNGFRLKGGKGELAARILVYPIAALFILGPVAGASGAAYATARNGDLTYLIPIFTVIFILQIFVSINISPPGLSFDPESLIRFPVSFPRFLTIRLFLGLLSASTIVGTLSLVAAAIAVSVVLPRLTFVALAAVLSLALADMLFIRMVFAWVDRWLSTRRAREIFTVLIFVFSIGIQYANVTFNNVGHHSNRAQQAAKYAAAARFLHHAQPFFMSLPPGLAGSAIGNAQVGRFAVAAADLGGVLLAAGLFLGVFAWRMSREYRGENLSEASARPAEAAHKVAPTKSQELAGLQAMPRPSSLSPASPITVSPVILATLEKEWLYVRRNLTQFYALIAPLAMVFILAGRLGGLSRTGLIFPVAAAYSILGVAALAYNQLGTDAAGVQFYFLAPISMRSIILGKNLFGFCINVVQVALLYLVLVFTSGVPGLWVTLTTLAWLVLAVLVNVTIGNMRSLTAPKKVDPSKLSRKQGSQLSALLAIGVMLALAAFGAGLIAVARILSLPWLPVPILLGLGGGAFVLYLAGLNRVDALALNHRETLIEELCKVSL